MTTIKKYYQNKPIGVCNGQRLSWPFRSQWACFLFKINAMKKSIWEKTIKVSGPYGEHTGKVIVTINHIPHYHYHKIEAFINGQMFVSNGGDLTSEDIVVTKSVEYIQLVTTELTKLANTPSEKTFIDKMNEIFND